MPNTSSRRARGLQPARLFAISRTIYNTGPPPRFASGGNLALVHHLGRLAGTRVAPARAGYFGAPPISSAATTTGYSHAPHPFSRKHTHRNTGQRDRSLCPISTLYINSTSAVVSPHPPAPKICPICDKQKQQPRVVGQRDSPFVPLRTRRKKPVQAKWLAPAFESNRFATCG